MKFVCLLVFIMFLSGCQSHYFPPLKFNDKVVVYQGFYEGSEGFVVKTECCDAWNNKVYTIRLWDSRVQEWFEVKLKREDLMVIIHSEIKPECGQVRFGF